MWWWVSDHLSLHVVEDDGTVAIVDVEEDDDGTAVVAVAGARTIPRLSASSLAARIPNRSAARRNHSFD